MIRNALNYFYNTYAEILGTIVKNKLDNLENQTNNYINNINNKTEPIMDGVEILRATARAEGLNNSEKIVNLAYYLTLAHYNQLTEEDSSKLEDAVNYIIEKYGYEKNYNIT